MLAAWTLPEYGPTLWLLALLGAFVTALYSFRLVFVVFFGDPSPHYADATENRGGVMAIPLVLLCILAVAGGFWGLNLDAALPSLAHPEVDSRVNWLTIGIPFFGVLLSYLLFTGKRPATRFVASAAGQQLHRFWLSGWGMDWLYQQLFVRPWIILARINRDDVIDQIYTAVAALNRWAHIALAITQTGRLRWYASSLALGVVLLLSLQFWP